METTSNVKVSVMHSRHPGKERQIFRGLPTIENLKGDFNYIAPSQKFAVQLSYIHEMRELHLKK
jgi:hypothetical protein